LNRFQIDEKGFVERNGIHAHLSLSSYFGAGEHPCMHFMRRDWGHYDAMYPEVSAKATITPIADFSWPHSGQCEFIILPDGRVQIRAHHSSLRTPVLDWIFPNPETYQEAIYTAFMRPTDREILDWTSDENIRHMREREQVEYFVGYVPTELLIEIGIARRSVPSMTTFAQIGILEHIHRLESASQHLPHGMLAELGSFLQTLDKEGFRTAED
jgi:hypothetical protein